MELYLEISGVLFHLIVGGVISLSILFYWTARDKRKANAQIEEDALNEANQMPEYLRPTPGPILS